MAQRSVALNGLEDRIRVVCCDLREAPDQLGTERFSLAVTNPPYTQRTRGLVSPSTLKAEARSADCPLEEWIHACARVLQFGGRLCMVYPASRLGEVIAAMQQVHVAPKRLRLVAKRPEHPPKLMLLEGKKGGGQGMIVEPLLVTHREDGAFSEEMRKIYGESS
jgi:tRNA1(Val) A37 N6-methylase TrmN6